MAKTKKIDDNTYLISDSITSEPIGVTKKSGSGKYTEYRTKLHQHVHQMFPEAGHILSRVPISNTIDGAQYETTKMVDKLADGHKHDFDVVKDPAQVEKTDFAGDTKKKDLYHIHDRETGKKILSLTHDYPLHSNTLGTGDKYSDVLNYHSTSLGTKDNVITAMKKEKCNDGSSLKKWVDVARSLKKVVSSGGPRFIGQQQTEGNKSTRRSYTSSIEDPKSAIDAYVSSGAIPNHEKMTKTVITPSMQLVHDDDENHIVKFKDGMIHHTSTTIPNYNSKNSLSHVIEEVI